MKLFFGIFCILQILCKACNKYQVSLISIEEFFNEGYSDKHGY
jgi:hypothetical protein